MACRGLEGPGRGTGGPNGAAGILCRVQGVLLLSLGCCEELAVGSALCPHSVSAAILTF